MKERSITEYQPVLGPRAGKGWKTMARIAQFLAGSGCHSGKARKALIITLTLTFLGLVGFPPGAAGQGLPQSPGTTQNPGAMSQNPQQNRFPQNAPPKFPRTTQKQKQALIAYNFKKLKQHAQDLADLVKSLQKEIEKSNENVLSLDIVRKADQVEKLAKKIKNEAKGY